AGRREHAGLRQEPEPARGHRAGGLPRDAASRRTAAGARCERAGRKQVKLAPAAALLVVAAVYARGWRELHARVPERYPPGRLAAFLSGVAGLGIAIAPRPDVYAGRWLQAHMAQHMLLLVVAPPVLWLGSPQLPLLRGLPAWLRSRVGSLQSAPPLPRLGARLSHPLPGWPPLPGAAG